MQSSAKKFVDAVMKCFDNSIKKHRETGKKEKLYVVCDLASRCLDSIRLSITLGERETRSCWGFFCNLLFLVLSVRQESITESTSAGTI